MNWYLIIMHVDVHSNTSKSVKDTVTTRSIIPLAVWSNIKFYVNHTDFKQNKQHTNIPSEAKCWCIWLFMSAANFWWVSERTLGFGSGPVFLSPVLWHSNDSQIHLCLGVQLWATLGSEMKNVKGVVSTPGLEPVYFGQFQRVLHTRELFHLRFS